MQKEDKDLLEEFENLIQDISQNVIENYVLQEFIEISSDINDGAEEINETLKSLKEERQETIKLKRIIKNDLENVVERTEKEVSFVNNSLKEVKNFYKSEKLNFERSRKNLEEQQKKGLEKLTEKIETHQKQLKEKVDKKIADINKRFKRRFVILILFNMITIGMIFIITLYPDLVMEFLNKLGL